MPGPLCLLIYNASVLILGGSYGVQEGKIILPLVKIGLDLNRKLSADSLYSENQSFEKDEDNKI